MPAAADTRAYVSLPLGVVTLSVTPQSLMAILVIVLLSLVHLRGVGPGRLMQNVLAALKVTALLLLIALGFSLGEGSTEHFQVGQPVAAAGWVLALVPVMFQLLGLECGGVRGGGSAEPRAVRPRARSPSAPAPSSPCTWC
jgi:amino acid transporter